MNRICKILAVILAVLMLVTMATACRRENGDDLDDVLKSETSSNKGNDTNDPDDPDDPSAPGGTDDPDDPSAPGGDPKDPDDPKTPSKDPSNPGGTYVPPDDYTPEVKYTHNPLVAEGKPFNTGVAPSFDIDTTGFVKNNIKIKDLKGKTLTLITSIMYSTFQYKGPKGEALNEWTWFDSMKSTYGLNLKYIKSRFDKSVQQSLTYMTAGKALDIIPTHVGGFPKFLNLSQPLDPYINIQNLGNSPGVDEMTLNETKWGGTYRCISPVGGVNVLWYNQSLVEQYGLKDPHTLFRQDKWDWDAFKSFVLSVPQTTPDGKVLCAYQQCTSDMMYSWPLTNGCAPIQIDTKSSTPNLINNWLDERTLAAWDFISGVAKSVNYGKNSYDKMYSEGTLMISDAVNLMNNWDQYDYAKTHKYNWVPFPKATTSTGRYVAFNYGYTHMIPRKVKNASNIPYAVKFMELWANRFTEAIFDYLGSMQFLQFDYAARKEYFEFVVKNTYFGVQMNEWDMITGENGTAKNEWFKSLYNSAFNIRTESEQMKNVVEQAIKDCLAYGL